ncbi:MAG TPA: hypothetical protein VFW28_16025 [Micropepsaceae bacterium]|nr:hypothetical protein [Micropepsaceae bacterium]
MICAPQGAAGDGGGEAPPPGGNGGWKSDSCFVFLSKRAYSGTARLVTIANG